jgi:hypothetical protein
LGAASNAIGAPIGLREIPRAGRAMFDVADESKADGAAIMRICGTFSIETPS